jgi:hypothetical protein
MMRRHMTQKHFRLFAAPLLLAGVALAVSGCSGAREQLGLTRTSPDEFAVVRRAPLEIPPEFSLRPPAPGAARPQETATIDEAANAVLGSAPRGANITSGEEALMMDAGVRYNPDIRAILDQDLANTAERDQPVAKRLLNIGKKQLPPATIVDANAEAERIRKNAEEGKAVTDGETPTIKD